MKPQKPIIARDSERLLVVEHTSYKPLYGIFKLALIGLCLALTVVLFMAPTLSKFYDWIDESIYHALVVFALTVIAMGVGLLYMKYKE